MIYANTHESLGSVLKSIEKAPWAAVDTEADSLHHYEEKLCLVQVSIPGEDFVIDPLAKLDLTPLVRILNPKPLIFHGSDFDIRILDRFHGFKPKDIFDTLLAAQLLGYEKKGLADLVEKHFAVKLCKTNQKADWSIRPLTDEMLVYAANDTHYLGELRRLMEKELLDLGRLDWQTQSCARLAQILHEPKEETRSADDAWQIKGSKKLQEEALKLLKAVWEWRESEAKRRDKPPFKVLQAEYLIQIADWASQNPGVDVADLPKAPRNVKREHREVLNDLLSRARALPDVFFKEKKFSFKGKRWNEFQKKYFEFLKVEREKKARELKLDPSLVATNAILETVVTALPKTREDLLKLGVFMPWQVEIFFDILRSNTGQL